MPARAGRFFDPGRLPLLARANAHVSMRASLDVPRPPPGQPVVVRTGAA